MTIWLIRHGSTEATEKHLYCGSTDLPLSELGRAALHPLPLPGDNLRYISSGMTRCSETLCLLFGDVPYIVEPAFREIDFGDFEMKGYEELKADAAYIRWLAGDNGKNTPPGGENGETMTRRVLAGLGQVISRRRDTVIVTHGGVIAAIMEALFPKEGKNRYQWQPMPGNGYVLCLYPEENRREYRPIDR